MEKKGTDRKNREEEKKKRNPLKCRNKKPLCNSDRPRPKQTQILFFFVVVVVYMY